MPSTQFNPSAAAGEAVDKTMAAMTEGESVNAAKKILSFEESWTNESWTTFYSEIHGKLFLAKQNPDVIANWYLVPLFQCKILNKNDLLRKVEQPGFSLSVIVDNTASVLKFFVENYNVPFSIYVDFTYVYGKGEKELRREIRASTNLLKAIEDDARECFNVPIAALKFDIIDDVGGTRPLKDDLELYKYGKVAPNVPIPKLKFDIINDKGGTTPLKGDQELYRNGQKVARIVVTNQQIGFSKTNSMQQALDMCGEGTKVQEEVRDLINAEQDAQTILTATTEVDHEVQHALATIRKYNVPVLLRVDFTYVYGKAKKERRRTIRASTNLLKAIEDDARECFNVPIAALKFDIIDDMGGTRPLKDDSELYTYGQKVVHIVVTNQQIGFSKTNSIQQALDICGKGTQLQEEVRDLLISEEDAKTILTATTEVDHEVQHALATIQKLEKALPLGKVKSCEITKRVYIDPILIAGTLIAGDVTMAVECNVEGPWGNGPVDYLFNYKDTCICVTEGKFDNLKHGLYQNIAQLAAVRSNRKRKHGGIDTNHGMDDDHDSSATGLKYYGVATTFQEWKLVELHQKQVKVSPAVTIGGGLGSLSEEHLRHIIALLTKVLQRAKENHDSKIK